MFVSWNTDILKEDKFPEFQHFQVRTHLKKGYFISNYAFNIAVSSVIQDHLQNKKLIVFLFF